MRMMGEQFVTGETIAEALAQRAHAGGEGLPLLVRHARRGGARPPSDAERYLAPTRTRSDAIGEASAGRGVLDGPGISIKLSALHPRYGRAQRERVMAEL